MAKLSPEQSEIIWELKRQLLETIERAKTSEFALFEGFGETEQTIAYLDELQSIAEQATERFSRFSTLQLRIANTQPPIPPDMLELVNRSIESTRQRIPALERSIQEIKLEWRLP